MNIIANNINDRFKVRFLIAILTHLSGRLFYNNAMYPNYFDFTFLSLATEIDYIKTNSNIIDSSSNTHIFNMFNNNSNLNKLISFIEIYIYLQEAILFLTVGEEKGPGLFLLAGPEEAVSSLASRYA